jgi:hypothetical protein
MVETFTFGSHKGKSFQHVLEHNEWYARWMFNLRSVSGPLLAFGHFCLRRLSAAELMVFIEKRGGHHDQYMDWDMLLEVVSRLLERRLPISQTTPIRKRPLSPFFDGMPASPHKCQRQDLPSPCEVRVKVMSLAKIELVSERRRHVRSLLREWHPDKNPDRCDEAKAAFQELQRLKPLLNLSQASVPP